MSDRVLSYGSLLIACVAVIVHGEVLGTWMLDDAFIFFRYAENWAAGNGLLFISDADARPAGAAATSPRRRPGPRRPPSARGRRRTPSRFSESESVDVVVSNCVVNLSPRKDLVLSEVFRLLRSGGEFYFSDVFADRRVQRCRRTVLPGCGNVPRLRAGRIDCACRNIDMHPVAMR